MSTDNDNIFEKYLEDKSFSQRLKEPRTWIFIVTALVVAVILVWSYKAVILDKVSAEEVKQSIQVLKIETKWVEKERTPEGVKIVPAINFKIKNIGTRPLSYVTFEGVFIFDETGQTHSDGLNQLFHEPLKPGETSGDIFIKSSYGYSASTMEAFFVNKENWKLMNVNVFAKTKGSGPVLIIEKKPVEQIIEGVQGTEISSEQKMQMRENAEKLAESIKVIEQTTKWVNKKISSEEVIIVPSITIKIGNDSKTALQDIVFRGSFLFVDNGEWLSDGITMALEEPLAPGEISDEILIKSENGYRATSKGAFIDNRDLWRKVNVNVYAKAADSDYTLLGTYPVSQDIQGVKIQYREVVK